MKFKLAIYNNIQHITINIMYIDIALFCIILLNHCSYIISFDFFCHFFMSYYNPYPIAFAKSVKF